jgi:S1-C subfamily serine protease
MLSLSLIATYAKQLAFDSHDGCRIPGVRAENIFGPQMALNPKWKILSVLVAVTAGVCDAQTKPANSPSAIYDRTHQSVVVIVSADKDAKPTGQGSGFIVSKNRVVTNHHVIDGAAVVIIVFADGGASEIDRIAADSPARDITILSVYTGTRPALSLGDELSVRQGDPVYALGAPRGLELSITNGIVSGFRHIDEEFMIQNTAPIAPGSSGGPLFDGEGRVIGVTTSLLTDSPGIYFSIGVGEVRRLLRTPNIVAGWEVGATKPIGPAP